MVFYLDRIDSLDPALRLYGFNTLGNSLAGPGFQEAEIAHRAALQLASSINLHAYWTSKNDTLKKRVFRRNGIARRSKGKGQFSCKSPLSRPPFVLSTGLCDHGSFVLFYAPSTAASSLKCILINTDEDQSIT